MTRPLIDCFKLTAMNTFSWIGTMVSLDVAIKWLQAVSLLGSVMVSLLSVIYLAMKIKAKGKE